MPRPPGTDWFRAPGATPRLTDRKPVLSRGFHAPGVLGVMVVALLLAVIVGFAGAYVYTTSDSGELKAVDPADKPVAEAEKRAKEEADRRAAQAALVKSPTTTRVEILSQDEVAKKVGPSVWTVRSLDEAGVATEGSAFVAGSFGGQTFLLTSLAVVRAATRAPGPEISVRNGGAEAKVTLWTWQEERDLALLVLPRSVPGLTWAVENPEGKPGDKVYAVAGGGAITAGVIGATSPAAIEHNIVVDTGRQGAPLLNERGEVLGMLSHEFNPGGAGTDRIFFAVPVRLACERVLSCGGGNATVPSTVAPTGPNATTPPTTSSSSAR